MKTPTPTKRGVGRPPLPESERKIQTYWLAHPKTMERARFLAKRKNLSMSIFISQMVEREWLSEHNT